MNSLRLSIAVMFAWLLLFYNIERFYEQINLASFVYVYAACIAMVIVAVPRLRAAPVTVTLSLLFAVFFGLKWFNGYQIADASLPLTVTEVTAIGVTFYLAWTIGRGIRQFEDSAAEVWSMHPKGLIPDFVDSQVEFYREVRRAREFDRPLTLLTIKSHGESETLKIGQIIEEMQRNMTRRYIDSRIGQIIAARAKDCDMIAYSDDHFVLLLPEVEATRAPEIVEDLNTAVKEATGIELQIGHAAFPADEVTLSGLLGRATSQMAFDDTSRPNEGATVGSYTGDISAISAVESTQPSNLSPGIT